MHPAVPLTGAVLRVEAFNDGGDTAKRMDFMKRHALTGAGIESVTDNLARIARIEAILNDPTAVPRVLFDRFEDRICAAASTGGTLTVIIFQSAKRLEEWWTNGDCSLPVIVEHVPMASILADAAKSAAYGTFLARYPKTTAHAKETDGHMLIVATLLRPIGALHSWCATGFKGNVRNPPEVLAQVRARYAAQFKLRAADEEKSGEADKDAAAKQSAGHND